MEFFRKLKHWQIFILVAGVPMLIQTIQNVLFITSDAENTTASSAGLGLLLIIPWLSYYGWIGAVGSAFSKNITSLAPARRKFKLSFWISWPAGILLFLYFWAFPLYLKPVGKEGVIPVTVIGVLVFIWLFTLFYCLSFMARSIVQRERESSIHSSEFFGEFVMAVLFPIGIWLLQPRINRLNRSEFN